MATYTEKWRQYTILAQATGDVAYETALGKGLRPEELHDAYRAAYDRVMMRFYEGEFCPECDRPIPIPHGTRCAHCQGE